MGGAEYMHWLKTIIVAVATAAVMLLLRTFVFTVYTVGNDNLRPDFMSGDRVIVNRLSRDSLQRGEHIAFSYNSSDFIGRVVALPGDTIPIAGQQYVIPARCNMVGCQCDDCHYYLVNSSSKASLVPGGNVIGRAYLLWR